VVLVVVARRPPQARSQLLGHDLDSGSGAAIPGCLGALLEPAHDYDSAALRERFVITALGDTTPMHRASQPEEIAEVVAFPASPRASYITGTTVAADGGGRAI
jgi:NAD(P)-dependent dehydrogenase (short-subunit alcohol dehydrogenase family)